MLVARKTPLRSKRLAPHCLRFGAETVYKRKDDETGGIDLIVRRNAVRGLPCLLLAWLLVQSASALNPQKSFEQYSQTVWGQQQGLPQDTITAIAQTADGYLWIGTDEGLARLDGYEFKLLDLAHGDLPSNSVKALAAAMDGSLWVGTASGLVHLVNGESHVYTIEHGLADNAIDQLCVDRVGHLWIAAGGALARFDGKSFSVFSPGKDLPITVRTVYEDPQSRLWVAGLGGVGQFSDGKFTPVIPWDVFAGSLITQLIRDAEGNLWIAGSLGIVRFSREGKIRTFTKLDGLPDNFVRALWLDRDGSLWAGTNSGLARLREDRFSAEGPTNLIRCLFEDREDNLWIGAGNGLIRLRDDIFTVYGKSEGLPSDSPNTVFEDRDGRVWVGFHDSALLVISKNRQRVFSAQDGFPAAEVFSIRQGQSGDLLLSTRAGLVRMRGSQFTTYASPDEFGRKQVFDALEDSTGRVWVALPNGLGQLQGQELRLAIPGGPLGITSIATLYESKDGALWAGTYEKGLWRVQGETMRHFTTDDGLSSNQIRSMVEDHEGTLWIATYGGGLNAYRGGEFTHFTAEDGLLSNNISNVLDDGETLWLSTTRGICRISRAQLNEYSEGKLQRLSPDSYGVEDGLRSAQAAPGYPVAGGGARTSDGRMWFPTSNGLAVIDPRMPRQAVPPPVVHIVDFSVDGASTILSRPLRLQPGTRRVEIRYAGIHLRAPERVEYSYKLEGLDVDWVRAGRRREANYNSLEPGRYRFHVRAELPGGPMDEASYDFEKLPAFYETIWFRTLGGVLILCAAWGAYKVRVRQLRYRFTLVLAERARLAREIHDTLAQGFVGISSQLDAVSAVLPGDQGAVHDGLNLARRMARHSLTEARRAIGDLRASVLEGSDLGTALRSGVQIWSTGSAVLVEVEVDVPAVSTLQGLSGEVQQQLLRIAQEAVTNALKHADAKKVVVRLRQEGSQLHLQIVDDGRGLQTKRGDSWWEGHFGLTGMRERAERVGGDFQLVSHPGEGTQIDVKVPL